MQECNCGAQSQTVETDIPRVPFFSKINVMERQRLIKLLQSYIGKQPRDVGCLSWNDMQQQLADKILKLKLK